MQWYAGSPQVETEPDVLTPTETQPVVLTPVDDVLTLVLSTHPDVAGDVLCTTPDVAGVVHTACIDATAAGKGTPTNAISAMQTATPHAAQRPPQLMCFWIRIFPQLLVHDLKVLQRRHEKL